MLVLRARYFGAHYRSALGAQPGTPRRALDLVNTGPGGIGGKRRRKPCVHPIRPT